MARNPSLEEERERGEPLDGAPLCTGYRRSLSFKRRCRHRRPLCTTAATDSLRAAGSKISSFFFLSRKEAAAGPCAALPAGGAHLHQEQEARAALVYSQLLGRRGGACGGGDDEPVQRLEGGHQLRKGRAQARVSENKGKNGETIAGDGRYVAREHTQQANE